MPPIRTALLTILLSAAPLSSHGSEQWSTADADEPTLDGTLTLSGRLLGAGVGYKWGRGTLNYQGQQFGFCIRGLSVGDVGIAKLTAQGDVFNLKDIADFSGRYVALSTGVALVRGEAAAILQNQHGVDIELQSTIRGVRLAFAATDVRITLAGAHGCTLANTPAR